MSQRRVSNTKVALVKSELETVKLRQNYDATALDENTKLLFSMVKEP
jgi:hypothetical protein